MVVPLYSDTAAPAKVASNKPAPRLERVTFETSRLGEFCSERELTAQIGHRSSEWPLVAAKEMIDNSIDGAEEAEIAPEIDISVDMLAARWNGA